MQGSPFMFEIFNWDKKTSFAGSVFFGLKFHTFLTENGREPMGS